MCSRSALGVAAPLAMLLLVGALPGFQSQGEPDQPRSGVAAEPRDQANGRHEPGPAAGADADAASLAAPTEVEKAIRAFEEGFVRDYNTGDSKAVAALFTQDAEVVDIEGQHFQGRDVIERGFAEMFADDKGAKIALEIFEIRPLSPDVAQRQGRSVVTPVEGAPGPACTRSSTSSATAAGWSRASGMIPTPWSRRTNGSRIWNG